MIEFTERDGDNVQFQRTATPGQNIVKKGSEARRRSRCCVPGLRLGFAELALAAQVGAAQRCAAPTVRASPSSPPATKSSQSDTQPGPFQIRNSNSVSLAAQIRLAGGEPVLLGNALDRVDDLGAKIELGLQEDILVLSGGVSMGKYDLVEDCPEISRRRILFSTP